MCKFLIYLALSIFTSIPCIAAEESSDSILKALDHVIERRDTYYTTHQWEIDSVKRELATVPDSDPKLQAQLLHDIFRRYRSFQGDSAQAVAKRELVLAKKINDPDAILRAQSDILFSYISTGNFTDAVDVVRHTDRRHVDPKTLGDFYFLCIRLYSDISNYSDGTFSDKNARLSHAYADSVITMMPPDSYEAHYASIFKTLDNLKIQEKIDIFEHLMLRHDIDNSEKAMIASILGDLYLEKGDTDTCIYYKARSAILDIQESKRETSSLRMLADLMFQNGKHEQASRYINVALEDANFFNAPHRKSEIANVLPLIESQRFNDADSERRHLLWILVGVIALFIALCVAVLFWLRTMKRLRASNKVIAERSAELEKANNRLADANRQVEQSNAQLKDTLKDLSESVRIKDEYIGYGFYANSEYIKKIESLYKLVNRKVKARQYDDLLLTLRDSDIRKEKEKMLHDFDSIFLRLFPSFVQQYNALFPAQHTPGADTSDVTSSTTETDSTLTPEMRIFALIRLGITDISKIATFLNYSVNTVNTYKTRAKNRSEIPNDRFEAAIMTIRSIA